MGLSFLPAAIALALGHLNYNFLSEIRIRKGKPVMVCYRGVYRYLGSNGICPLRKNSIVCDDIQSIVISATGGSLYSYSEQIKRGFITCGNGVRIGLAGEYVTQDKAVNTITGFTSLNVRIPHEIKGCAGYICKNLLKSNLCNILLYSKPGLGKTTKLRDIARYLSDEREYNVLILDERNEISAMDGDGVGFDVGIRTDVVRSGNKFGSVENAIRAMKPDVIITDELHGDSDREAVAYARECGISVIASSHLTDREKLKLMPFDYFAELISVDKDPLIYDKNFNFVCGDGSDNAVGSTSLCG